LIGISRKTLKSTWKRASCQTWKGYQCTIVCRPVRGR